MQGDAQLSAKTTIFNFDMGAAYTKFLQDIQDSQMFLGPRWETMFPCFLTMS